jgi:hypothetical protein
MRCRVSPKEPMTIRLVGALLCGAALILATQVDLAQAEQKTRRGGFIIPVVAVVAIAKKKPAGIGHTNRMGGGGGGKGAAGVATVKKGGGGGAGGPAYLNPQPEPPGRAKIR